jgi:DNA repair ATPase RecN
MPNLSIENWISAIGVIIALFMMYRDNRKTREHAIKQTQKQESNLNQWQLDREKIDSAQNEKLIEIENSVNTLSKVQSEQSYDITLLQRENSVTVELLKKIEHSLDELKSLPSELKFIKELFEEKLNNVKRPYNRIQK